MDTPPSSTFGEVGVAPPKTSGLAVASLVCGLIFFCPVTTVLAPLLGVAAAARLHGNPALRGRGLAAVGSVIGIVATALWVLAGVRFYGAMIGPVYERPGEALRAGFAGDTAGFRACFYGPGETAADSEAQIFVEALRQRYGEFASGSPREPVGPGGPIMTFSYVLRFGTRTVPAEIRVVMADPDAGAWPGRLAWIRVIDPELGDLSFPRRHPDLEAGSAGGGDPGGDGG